MSRDPIWVAARVAQALTSCGASYLVGGSLASSQYGFPRTTQDVDLVADLHEEQIDCLVDDLQDEFYIDAGMMRDAIQARSSFNVIHLTMAHKVDIFLTRSDAWSLQQLARRRIHTLGDGKATISLYFSTPEDVILSKLDWYRQGGGLSGRQWDDVLGVLKVQQTELDVSYLRHWATELGLRDLLERAQQEAEPPEEPMEPSSR